MANSFFWKNSPKSQDTRAPTHQNIRMDLSHRQKQWPAEPGISFFLLACDGVQGSQWEASERWGGGGQDEGRWVLTWGLEQWLLLMLCRYFTTFPVVSPPAWFLMNTSLAPLPKRVPLTQHGISNPSPSHSNPLLPPYSPNSSPFTIPLSSSPFPSITYASHSPSMKSGLTLLWFWTLHLVITSSILSQHCHKGLI